MINFSIPEQATYQDLLQPYIDIDNEFEKIIHKLPEETIEQLEKKVRALTLRLKFLQDYAYPAYIRIQKSIHKEKIQKHG